MTKKKMTMDEKLKIINAGGEVDESAEHGSWIGTKIRKGDKLGKIVKDMNGMFRRLTVDFEDGTKENIILNNVGSDPKECHQYEWQTRPISDGTHKGKTVWYRF